MIVLMGGDDISRVSDPVLLRGGAEEFGAFYRRHEEVVLGFFVRRTGRADLAADLTAETFARALAGRERFDSTLGEAVGWLFGIARHVLARSLEGGRVDDAMRRELGMERLILDNDVLANIESADYGPALRALEALPADQREAVTARVLSEREYREVAMELECSESVVRQRVSRGLRALHERLKETQ